jgi:hypothetical protein
MSIDFEVAGENWKVVGKFEARVVFWYCLPPNPLPNMHSSIQEFFFRYPASNRRELRLHLNIVPTGAGVFKSRHILLHKYVNRIMITYLWRQIQLIIPSRRFRSIECRHFYLFWKYVTWSLFPRITWYSLFHTSDLLVLKHSFLVLRTCGSHPRWRLMHKIQKCSWSHWIVKYILY